MGNILLGNPSLPNQVLIVDDEEKLGRFVSIVLKQIGYMPVNCQSVAEARKQIEARRWSLVITDIVMPRESGFDLMRWIAHQYPHLPVIAMTAHSTKAIENQLPKLGFVDVVYKPFTVDTLRHVVQRIVPLPTSVEMVH